MTDDEKPLWLVAAELAHATGNGWGTWATGRAHLCPALFVSLPADDPSDGVAYVDHCRLHNIDVGIAPALELTIGRERWRVNPLRFSASGANVMIWVGPFTMRLWQDGSVASVNKDPGIGAELDDLERCTELGGVAKRALLRWSPR